jgi:hypothetical protein
LCVVGLRGREEKRREENRGKEKRRREERKGEEGLTTQKSLLFSH